MRPEIPNYPSNRFAIAPMRWYEPCNAPYRPAASISLEPFKRLSLETIKAQRANVTGAAAMCASCVHTQTLSQCNRVNVNSLAVNPRGDEREMKL
jgi:hypothetical protein